MPSSSSSRVLLLALSLSAVSRRAYCDLCAPAAGVNCEQHDIADAGVVASAAACCAACTAQSGCQAWTWNGGGDQHCWVKSSCAGAVPDAAATSGARAWPSPAPPAPVPPGWHNGVSIGGHLLMEPSWMYDQFSAPAEGDFVRALRAAGGDDFAIATMKNHWQGYISDAALDALATLGVSHARIPVGYWIIEAPVALAAGADGLRRTPTMYDYGFNHEGFVTGGINALEALLAKLKARGIKALVDLHALPGGASSCQSYAGWQVNQPLFWQGTPPPSNATPVAGACGGAGPYYTSRGAAATWMAVGEAALLALADWIVALEAKPALSGVVVGLEVANEPGLGFNGVQKDIERLLTSVVPALQAKLAATDVNVTVNFISPNDVDAGAWVAAQVKSGLFKPVLVDYHQYYNWDGPESWQSLGTKICGTTASASPFAQYTAAGLPVLIGEWSCSTNLGARAFTDLTNASVVAHLKSLYANQMSLFGSRGGDAPGAVGQHHWTLRMGSGWEPRPTAENPAGAQVPGSAWNKSLPSFSEAVWSLGELIRHGVAQPLAALNITGVCRCNGCSVAG